MCGGFGQEKTDAETLALFSTAEVTAAVNSALGSSYGAVTAVAFKSQVVRATYYLAGHGQRCTLGTLLPRAIRAVV